MRALCGYIACLKKAGRGQSLPRCLGVDMEQLKACPFCGGKMRVRMYDENLYRAALGEGFEWDPEYELEHVDRIAAVKAKCPFEKLFYKAKAEAIDAWNVRSIESANGLVYIPSFRDNGEFPEHIWASLNGEAIRYVRERTCRIVKSEFDGQMWVFCHEFSCDCGQRNLFTSDSKPPNYCPNCGARVGDK